MTPPTDHDLIVEHSVKIDTLCGLVKDQIGKIELERSRVSETHREIFLKVDKKTDDTTFRWVAGILISVVILLFSCFGAGMMQVNDNGHDIEQILEAHE